jgi:hypothetical protein
MPDLLCPQGLVVSPVGLLQLWNEHSALSKRAFGKIVGAPAGTETIEKQTGGALF